MLTLLEAAGAGAAAGPFVDERRVVVFAAGASVVPVAATFWFTSAFTKFCVVFACSMVCELMLVTRNSSNDAFFFAMILSFLSKLSRAPGGLLFLPMREV